MIRILHFLILTVAFGCSLDNMTSSGLNDDQSDGSYSITTRVEVVKPVNLEAMTTEFQTARQVEESDNTVTVDISVDPNFDQLAELRANPSWREEYSADPSLEKYLSPGVTTNWDAVMRAELIAALAEDDIDVNSLNDVELVKAVSKWVFASDEFSFLDHFVSYNVEFEISEAKIIPELRAAFDYEKSKNGFESDQEALNVGIFGKEMFMARKYGNCTASATLIATVLKALGIPTRLVISIPLVDANDPNQLNMARDGINHNGLKKTVMEGLSKSAASWSSHTFNEVYIGNKWVRLNYTTLGQNTADSFFLGLMVQVQSMADWADPNLGLTWGIHAQSRRLAELSSRNPYRSHWVTDTVSVLNDDNNPFVPFNEMKVVKLLEAKNSDDSSLPSDVRSVLAYGGFLVTFEHQDAIPDYSYIALFRQHVSRKFTLKANGHPDLEVWEDGSWTQEDAVGFRVSPTNIQDMVAGVEYTLHPESNSGEYRWEPSQNLRFVKPSSLPPVPQPDEEVGEVFNKTATVVMVKVASAEELNCDEGRICIILGLNEKYAGDPMQSFYANVSKDFTLEAEGKPSISGKLYGFTLWGTSGTKAGLTLMLEEGTAASMVEGISYKIVYPNPVQGDYSWIFPNELSVIR